MTFLLFPVFSKVIFIYSWNASPSFCWHEIFKEIEKFGKTKLCPVQFTNTSNLELLKLLGNFSLGSIDRAWVH